MQPKSRNVTSAGLHHEALEVPHARHERACRGDRGLGAARRSIEIEIVVGAASFAEQHPRRRFHAELAGQARGRPHPAQTTRQLVQVIGHPS
jgi:hypothetical protein